jgi:hypothetical protein
MMGSFLNWILKRPMIRLNGPSYNKLCVSKVSLVNGVTRYTTWYREDMLLLKSMRKSVLSLVHRRG